MADIIVTAIQLLKFFMGFFTVFMLFALIAKD